MKRSKFNLSRYHLLTGDLGQLLPVGLTEVLPGDSFDHSTSAMIRLSPMAAPVMHPLSIRIHHFFVPHRLIWEAAGGTGSFEDFITSGPDGNDAQEVPTELTTGTPNDLLDYYGIPPVPGVAVSSLPITGFNHIFNEYYRDQDLVTDRLDDDHTVPFVAWEKDYLTSARPWPQKGPDITMPVAGAAPVMGLGYTLTGVTGNVFDSNTGENTGDSGSYGEAAIKHSGGAELPFVYADLSQAEAVQINEFRKAFALQRYAEARARYGSRYTEYLRYLGITPSDARLDRPEYLGGGKVRMAISEVLQTAPESQGEQRDYGVGDMYGHGVGAIRTNRYRRFFEEHGYVHTLLSVRPSAMYSDGVDRTWLRKTREDFWQRELQHIGQQPVLKNEVYADPTDGSTIWGYQDRYREFREANSHISAEFRDVLNYWHLARQFTTDPVLNADFVNCNPGKRIFNEQTQHSLWCMCQHHLMARRMVARNASGRIL